MYFQKCDHCGHLNPLSSEHLIFCEGCNRKLLHNYTDWHARFPLKTFQDFKLEQCVEEASRDIPTSVPQQKSTETKRGGWIFVSVLLLLVVAGCVISRFVIKNSEKIVGFSPDEIGFLASDSARWIPFVCAEGGFRAYFPGNPEGTTNVSRTDIGDIGVVSFFLNTEEVNSDNLVYGVGYSVYPDNFMEQYGSLSYNIDMIFDGAVMGSVDDAGARLISSYYVDWRGYQGRAVQAELNGGNQVLVMRFYLVNNVMYCLQVIAMADRYPNKAGDFFFGSFNLLQGNKVGE